jgi:hypothetical protein
MKPLPPKNLTAEQAAALASREKKRILMMSVLALVLAASYLYSRQWRRAKIDEEQGGLASQLDLQPQVREKVFVPDFDQLAVLEEIRDKRPEDRVLEDGAPLDAVLTYGRLLTPRHLEEMGAEELTPERAAAIAADPSQHRIAALRAHGTIADLATRQRDGKTTEYVGSMRLEGGGYAHFVLRSEPKGLGVGDFALLDGLFLKLFSARVDGNWREGPLIVGGRLAPSWPDAPNPAGLAALLEEVRDDELSDFTGLPWDVLWEHMRQVREPATAAEWDAAPVINHELLTKIFTDGEAYRGKPFRFPVCINVHTWVDRPGENPARLAAFTNGWMGNMTWKGQAKVIQFFMPGAHEELIDKEGVAHYLTARGYFIKNFIYEARRGATERVPLFVMESVEPFTPPEDPLPRRILWAIFGGTLFFIALFWFLVVRDRRKALALQEELTRRRRARRARLAESV